MAITKEKKQEILSKLEGIKKDSETVVFVGFNGLDVSSETAMRNTLREAGVGYFVAKKTLIDRALGDAFEGEKPALEGEVALAYLSASGDGRAGGSDAITPAQQIRDFMKKYEDNVTILGGVFQGVYKSKDEMTEIASIPSMHVLRGMFVNVINSPVQGLAVALNAIAEKKGQMA